jgi:Protein of unknown function (DUF3300)
MNRTCIKGFLFILVMCLSALLSIQAGEGATSPTYLITEQELDGVLAPIALYPDPLLAELLPASTYPAEIADAAAWLRSGQDPSRIDDQNWDEAVRAIAHYPDILNMMADNINWTADLGDAFLNQPENVARSIQRLRWQARNAGNLENTSQQTVMIDGDYIQIIPAQPQYIYVPQYDPSVIYIERWSPGGSPFMTFGLGLAIGGWLSMDFDWGHHHVIYHGWNRPGWVNHSRPYVRITNVYVNRSRPSINQTWRHDASRGNPEKYRASRPGGSPSVGRPARTPEVRGRTTIPPGPSVGMFGPKGDTHSFSNRGKESLGIVPVRPTVPAQDLTKRPTIPAPSISKGSSQARPARESLQPPRMPSVTLPAPGVSKGPTQARPARESLQPPPRTPSVTFGGYRGANEARTQSLRGQASRQSSEGIRPSAAPASKVSAPAGRTATGGKEGKQSKEDKKGSSR